MFKDFEEIERDYTTYRRNKPTPEYFWVTRHYSRIASRLFGGAWFVTEDGRGENVAYTVREAQGFGRIQAHGIYTELAEAIAAARAAAN